MKKSLSISLITLIISVFITAGGNSQDDPFELCKDRISTSYVINSQPLQAFLTGNEVAEFHTTFLSGSIYRISACSGKNEPILFSIYDTNRKLLFSNADHKNAKVWDFKMDGSIECIIEARLDPTLSTSGMALMFIGFKSLDDK